MYVNYLSMFVALSIWIKYEHAAFISYLQNPDIQRKQKYHHVHSLHFIEAGRCCDYIRALGYNTF